MDNESSLSEILNETAPQPDLNQSVPDDLNGSDETPKESVESEKTPETPAKTEKTASEPEKGVKQPDEPPSSAKEKTDQEPPQVPIASLHDERRKRQELERRLAAIEQERNQVPPPDVFENPEEYTAYHENKRQTERLQDRISMSQQLVSSQVGEEEYSKAEAAFADEVGRNPALAYELRNHPNPAKFAFDVGRAVLDRQEIGDPREFAAKQVAKALEDQKASMASEIARQVQEQVAKLVPRSLADTQSAGARSQQTPFDDGPTPIEQLLPK